MSLYIDIKKNFETFHLCTQFEIQSETLGILGASGCGKSLTLKCIAGIITPDEGTIILNDQVLFDSKTKVNLPPQKRKAGYLFQNYALFPHMNVAQNIGIGVHKSSSEKKQIIQATLQTFHLDGLEKHYPSQLSGGQQQRVALARIFASQPDLLMLDEPFSALDTTLRWELEQEMFELLTHFKKPALFVSHNPQEVSHLCTQIALMHTGNIAQIGTAEHLLSQPTTLSAALLLGCKNISPAIKLSEYTLKALDWDLVLQSSTPIPAQIKHVGIESHALELADDTIAPNSAHYEVVRVIQNNLSVIIGLRPLHSHTPKALLYMEMGKVQWQQLPSRSTYSCVIPSQKLLLLT